MNHPVVIAALALDGLALLAVSGAAFFSIRVLLKPGEQPSHAPRAWVLGRAGTAAFVLATVCFVAALTCFLPGRIKGAMCAAGVLQAMAGLGQKALMLRAAALAGLGLWHLLARLNRARPARPLGIYPERTALLAAPLVFVAAWTSLSSFLRLDPERPVSCCAAVYDRAGGAWGASLAAHIPPEAWMGLAAAVTLALAALGTWMALTRPGRPLLVSGLFAVLSILWIPAAAAVLLQTLAPFHFNRPDHHCPWCLFLYKHHLVGYALLGCLVVVGLQGLAALLCAFIARRVPDLEAKALRRMGSAGLGAAMAVALFWILAAFPVLCQIFKDAG
jgi:hypothetical protein